MVRCKHVSNVSVLEYYKNFSTEHTFEYGKYSGSNNNHGDYNGIVQINCMDCGKEFTFRRFNKNLPKWVQKYLSSLNHIR